MTPRAEAILRALSPWLSTLSEEDCETVDALVWHLIVRREELQHERDHELIARIRALRAPELTPEQFVDVSGGKP